MSHDPPRPSEPSLDDAHELVRLALADLGRWDEALRKTVETLAPGHFEDDTGRPLDLTAAVRAEMKTLLEDELGPGADRLRRVTTWLEEPSAWEPLPEIPDVPSLPLAWWTDQNDSKPC